MSETDKLKPCPFCGNAEIAIWDASDSSAPQSWSIGCTSCGCEINSEGGLERVIRIWNTRAEL